MPVLFKKIALFTTTLLLCLTYNLQFWLHFSFTFIRTHEKELLTLATSGWVLLVTGLLFLYRKQLKKFNPQHFGFKKITKQNRKLIIAAFCLASGLSLLNTDAFKQPQLAKALTFYPTLAGLSTFLFAPVLDELVNRGLFFNLFFKQNTKQNQIAGTLVSGIIFAVTHGLTGVNELLLSALFGWLLSALYLKTKNLAVPIALHLVINLI